MNIDIEPAGELVTAGLAASEIEGDSTPHGAHGAHPAHCANCQAALAGNFCQACGQRAHLHRSLLHLGEELAHGTLHFDAKAWRTLPMLVARPGQLTRRYVDGQRTRFVSPLALFLFMIFFMFFVVSWVSQDSGSSNGDAGSATGDKVVAKAQAKMEKALAKSATRLAKAEVTLAMAKANNKDAAAAQSDRDAALEEVMAGKQALKELKAASDEPAAKAGEAASESGPASYWSNSDVDTGWPAADAALKHALANPELTIYKLKNAASKYSFLLVPISLPFLWLMFFWRRGITMYDHAVFVLYSLSFMALLVVLLALLKMAGMKSAVVLLLCFIPPVHMFMQLRGAYGLGVRSALWRTMALLFVSGTVFLLYLLLILVLSMR
jgi:hypothetical protein